jgi:hypothetical protein
MLSFDALGRLGLGQLPATKSLPAVAGSYVVTGASAAFTIGEAAAIGSCAVSGVSASFAAMWIASGTSYAMAGSSIPDIVSEAAGSGTYTVTSPDIQPVRASGNMLGSGALGSGALGQITQRQINSGPTFAFVEAASGGSISITPGPLNALTRTGADFDLVYGGIGHYLEEIRRLESLQKITRKTPAPIVQQNMPLPQPPAALPVAPQAPAMDMQAIATQRMAVQQAQQAATQKRRRQDIEILLLAS